MPSKKGDFYYLRLSKEDGDKENGSDVESCSITSQRKCIKNFLKENRFFADDFAESIDDGYSGTDMDRPGMQRLFGKRSSRISGIKNKKGHVLFIHFPRILIAFFNTSRASFASCSSRFNLAISLASSLA